MIKTLKRPINENDLKSKGLPFECSNCGNKPVASQVIEFYGDCEICGDTIITYTVDTAEIIAKLEGDLKTAWEQGFKLCSQYGDNKQHFYGAEKERHWKKFRENKPIIEDRNPSTWP